MKDMIEVCIHCGHPFDNPDTRVDFGGGPAHMTCHRFHGHSAKDSAFRQECAKEFCKAFLSHDTWQQGLKAVSQQSGEMFAQTVAKASIEQADALIEEGETGMKQNWYWIGTGNKTHAILNPAVSTVALCGQVGKHAIASSPSPWQKCKRCLKALEKHQPKVD